MLERCTPGSRDAKYYYDRGIRVCDRWQKFSSFLEDMGMRPSPLHSLDRRNNNRGYAPANCRWATKSEQMRNTRSNVMIRAFGETKCVTAWAKDPRCGVAKNTIYGRISRGYCGQDAVARPNDYYIAYKPRLKCGDKRHGN